MAHVSVVHLSLSTQATGDESQLPVARLQAYEVQDVFALHVVGVYTQPPCATTQAADSQRFLRLHVKAAVLGHELAVSLHVYRLQISLEGQGLGDNGT